jgi:hypothetical protein
MTGAERKPLSEGARAYLRQKFADMGIESSLPNMTLSPPSIVSRPVSSEVVRVLPGMSAETVMLTTYRHDGRPFLRIELPADLAPAWIARLERYTIQHDGTRPPPLRLL